MSTLTDVARVRGACRARRVSVDVRGARGCVFAWERPDEWESRALLGLTAASWCCSRKSCWTCACLLAANFVCLCIFASIGWVLVPFLLGHSSPPQPPPPFSSSSSTPLSLRWSSSESCIKSSQQPFAKTHTCEADKTLVWFFVTMQPTELETGEFRYDSIVMRKCDLLPSRFKGHTAFWHVLYHYYCDSKFLARSPLMGSTCLNRFRSI